MCEQMWCPLFLVDIWQLFMRRWAEVNPLLWDVPYAIWFRRSWAGWLEMRRLRFWVPSSWVLGYEVELRLLSVLEGGSCSRWVQIVWLQNQIFRVPLILYIWIRCWKPLRILLPDIFQFTHTTYFSPLHLFWGDWFILSAKGVQQGDWPFGTFPVLFEHLRILSLCIVWFLCLLPWLHQNGGFLSVRSSSEAPSQFGTILTSLSGARMTLHMPLFWALPLGDGRSRSEAIGEKIAVLKRVPKLSRVTVICSDNCLPFLSFSTCCVEHCALSPRLWLEAMTKLPVWKDSIEQTWLGKGKGYWQNALNQGEPCQWLLPD